MGKSQTDPKNQENTLPESSKIDELTQDEIEKLARAIIHQAVEESKLCSIREDNQTRVEKKYAHYWIH